MENDAEYSDGKTVDSEEQNKETNSLYDELMLTKSKLASAEKKLSFADPELNKVAAIAATLIKYDEKEDKVTVEK